MTSENFIVKSTRVPIFAIKIDKYRIPKESPTRQN
jgi:hypothetical protein